MKKKYYYLALSLATLCWMTGCSDIDELNDYPSTESAALHSPQVVPGKLNICFSSKAAASIESDTTYIDRLRTELGAVKLRRIFPYNAKFDAQARRYNLDRWYEASFADSFSTVPVSRAGNIADVEVVEPIYCITIPREVGENSHNPGSFPAYTRSDVAPAQYPFNDPDLKKQWHYHNDGQLPHTLAGSDINLFKAWEIETGKPEVIVAIIDGGVQHDHADLAANMWVNQKEKNGEPGVDDDENGYIDDIHGYDFMYNSGTIRPNFHGTHVAGTVAAVNNNGIGLCGVAGGSGKGDGVRLMSVSGGDNVQAIAVSPASFYYAVINGAVIAQCSWGAPVLSQLWSDVLLFFREQAGTDGEGNQVGPMKGGIVIVAAGNDGMDFDQAPSSNSGVLTVGSIGADYQLASYSNYGSWVDIVAPGGDGWRRYSIISCGSPVGYGYSTGTSMACPHVSGVAALVISKFGGEGFTPTMLKQRLLSSARNIDAWNPNYRGKMGVGLVDAARALSLEPIIECTAASSIELHVGQSCVVDYKISDPENRSFTFELTADYPFITKQATASTLKLSMCPTATDVGTHQLVLRAVNEMGSEATRTLEVVVKATNSPTVEFAVYPNPVRTQATISIPNRPFVALTIRLHDTAGRQVIYKTVTTSAQGIYTLDMSTMASGSYTLTLEVDGQKLNKTIVKQ